MEKFDGVLNNGKDFDMSKICSCSSHSMDWCEKNCGKYYSCDSIAMADDVLKEYEECLSELTEKIDKAINNQAKKLGKMGTEVVNISIELTVEEKGLFFEIEKYNSENYFFDFDENVLYMSYVEEPTLYENESMKLVKRICDCLSDGYDDEEYREETQDALYNELSQIGRDSFIRAAFVRLCERIEELEE